MTQPERSPDDGPVGVQRRTDGLYVLNVQHGGQDQQIIMSGFNTWRVFGMLAMLLQVRLPKVVLKGIRL